MPRDNRCMYMVHVCFMSVVMTVWGFVGMFRVFRCDGDVICVGHDLNRCSGWWYVLSVNDE